MVFSRKSLSLYSNKCSSQVTFKGKGEKKMQLPMHLTLLKCEQYRELVHYFFLVLKTWIKIQYKAQ